MAAVSRARLRLSGSHAGVSIGEDGPSQMGLEDVAMLRAVHGSIVLHPCDANPTAQLVAAMAAHDGIAYLRTLRGATPVLYGPDDGFPVGGSKVPRSSDDDVVATVVAGITVHEALKAADALAAEGIAVRVVDAYSVKPLDDGDAARRGRGHGRRRDGRGPLARGRAGRGRLAALAEGCARPSGSPSPACPLGQARRVPGRRRHRRRRHRRRRPRELVGAARSAPRRVAHGDGATSGRGRGQTPAALWSRLDAAATNRGAPVGSS